MTFIEEVSVDASVELYELNKASSLWRRKIEARRSLDWVCMTDDFVIQLNGVGITTTVATVLDIEYSDTVTITILSSYLGDGALDVFGISIATPADLHNGLELHIPVTVSNGVMSPMTSAYVTQEDDSGGTVIQVLAKVLGRY